jgi:hypothetical protein
VTWWRIHVAVRIHESFVVATYLIFIFILLIVPPRDLIAGSSWRGLKIICIQSLEEAGNPTHPRAKWIEIAHVASSEDQHCSRSGKESGKRSLVGKRK